MYLFLNFLQKRGSLCGCNALKKNIRRLKVLFFTLRYPPLAKEGLKNVLDVSYYKGMLKKSKIENTSLDQIINLCNEIRLLNFDVRCGNIVVPIQSDRKIFCFVLSY
ncbi:MAG: hypothetical protein M3A24_03065 [Candidatus Rhabdochlamydia oedothoracis]|nr:hypothetical protein [Candidatus Rhabdochlamydia oedothoracis]